MGQGGYCGGDARLTSHREGKIVTRLCLPKTVGIFYVLQFLLCRNSRGTFLCMDSPPSVAQEKRLVCQGDSRAGEGQPTDLKFAVIQINNLLVKC